MTEHQYLCGCTVDFERKKVRLCVDCQKPSTDLRKKRIPTNNKPPRAYESVLDISKHSKTENGLLVSFNLDNRERTTCLNCNRNYIITSERPRPFSEMRITGYNFCSHNCKSKFLYREICFNLTQNQIVNAVKGLFPYKKGVVFSKTLIFELIQRMIELNLYTISELAHGSSTKLVAHSDELITGSFTGSSLSYMRDEPMSHEPGIRSKPGSRMSQQMGLWRYF